MLEEEFRKTVGWYENDAGVISKMWTEIITAYSGGGRYYHNLAHLENMLQQLLLVKNQIADWDAIIFALVYHDIIYEPLQQNNENSSAVFAENRLKMLGSDPAKISRIIALILATKTHELSIDSDTNYFLDADLSILGSEAQQYDQYAEKIRKEYWVVPDEQYIPGRIKVLRHFLTMSAIYKTDHFKNLLEHSARRNLEREQNLLSAGS